MLFLSTSCIKNKNILESISDLSKITNNIELSGGSFYVERLFAEFTQLSGEGKYNFLLHCYFPPSLNPFVLNFADNGDLTRNFIRGSVEYLNLLNISYYSIHAGFRHTFKFDNEILVEGVDNFSEQDIVDNARWFKKNFPDVKLAIENLYPNGGNLNSCFLMGIKEIVNFFRNNKDLFLLLDLGHLKVSSRIMNFDYIDAVAEIIDNFKDRIKEIHLSENTGNEDDHLLVFSDSIQYKIVRDNIGIIKKNNINLTIEARNYSLNELEKCYRLFNELLT
jgi:sugar phosphate isomerase/epimerase